MKKIISLFFVFSFIFCLAGCTPDLESERMAVMEENLKTENILEKYNKSIGNIEYFNLAFIDSVGYSFDEKVNNYGFNVTPYIDSIHEKITQNCETVEQFSGIEVDENVVYGSLSFDFKPFFVEETGKVEEYIFISGDYVEIVLIVYWNDGKIEDIVFQ